MGLEGENDHRRELYNKFRAQLEQGADEIFYDEDELIDIYDQASDMADENVKLHVLLVAYRLYPGSEEIAARRGYFLWSYRMDEGVEQLLKQHAHSNELIWKLLALRSRSISTPEELTAKLEELLRTQTDIDDETMIQLVNLASESGAYQWLKDNEKLLRGKTDYLPTLLFELQAVALTHDDRAFAIAKLEELTELEPFAPDYWVILSEELMNDGQIDAAINAADYALAIDSENKDAILARCRAVVCQNDCNPSEVIRLVEPLLKNEPDTSDSRALRLMVAALLKLDRTDEAMALLEERIGYTISDRSVIEYLLALRYPKIDEVLLAHYHALGEDSTEDYWCGWAGEKFAEGKFKEASMIFSAYAANSDISEANFDLYVTALYLAQYYRTVATLFQEEMKAASAPDGVNPELALAGILSLIRLGETDSAKAYVEKLLQALPSGLLSIGSILRNSGYFTMLHMLNRVIESNRTAEMDTFDPFVDLRDPEIDY